MENQVMMKNYIRLGVGLMTLFAFALALPMAAGQVVALPTISGGWGAMGLALDPVTDDIMVVGSGNSFAADFVAASLTYNGAVNTAFGGGIVVDAVSSGGEQNWPNACAIDYAGKLLSAGQYTYSSKKASGWGFATVRYNTNGRSTPPSAARESSPKTSATRLESAPWSCRAAGAAKKSWLPEINLKRSTRCCCAVYQERGAGHNLRLRRHRHRYHALRQRRGQDVALQSNGSIVVCIWIETSQGISMGLMCYTANGVLDTSFGPNGNGYVTLMVDGQDTWPRGIAVDADDNIVVAGFYGNGSQAMALVRFTADGELDGTFGSGGIVTESFAKAAYSVVINSQGNIVISGVAPNGENLVVARFTSDGDLDNTFGSTGGVFNGQGYADDFAYSPEGISHSVQIQSDGQIILVGCDEDGVNAVVRYNSNGTPDTTFSRLWEPSRSGKHFTLIEKRPVSPSDHAHARRYFPRGWSARSIPNMPNANSPRGVNHDHISFPTSFYSVRFNAPFPKEHIFVLVQPSFRHGRRPSVVGGSPPSIRIQRQGGRYHLQHC